MKLGAVAKVLGGEVSGDADLEVTRLVHPADAEGPNDLAMAVTDDTLAMLASPAVAAVVRTKADPPDGFSLIRFGGHERMALAILTRLFDPGPVHAPGVDPTAAVAADAIIGEGASIGALVSIGPRTKIGAHTTILAGTSIGAGVRIGRDCLIHSGARIGDRVAIGDRVVIHANAVIGSDGFSVIPVRNPDGSRNPIDLPARVHSLGAVLIGDDVEVGAGTTIDRGTLRHTQIGRGTKIDNQVQIAHNVIIGECCIICGTVAIAGSAEIGDRVILAGSSAVSDHIKVGSDATLSAMAAVISEVPAGTIVDGIPALRRDLAFERYLNVGRLKTLYPRVDDLKKRVEALEKGDKGG